MTDVTSQHSPSSAKKKISLEVLKVPTLMHWTQSGFQNVTNNSAMRSQSHMTHYSMGSVFTLSGENNRARSKLNEYRK